MSKIQTHLAISNKDRTLVSVIMSAYNHAAYVEQAIESILAQTYDNFELLVIDDGSSDDTAAIIEKLSRTHGFYFKRQENRGLPVTLNELVQISSGDYITACASDDFWPSTRLDEQVSLLVNNPEYDIVHSDVFMSIQRDSHLIQKNSIRASQLMARMNIYPSLHICGDTILRQ